MNARIKMLSTLCGAAIVIVLALWLFGALTDADCKFTFGRVELNSLACDSVSVVTPAAATTTKTATLPGGTAGQLFELDFTTAPERFNVVQLDVICKAGAVDSLVQIGETSAGDTALDPSYYIGRGCGSHDLFLPGSTALVVATDTSTLTINLWIVEASGYLDDLNTTVP